MVPTDTRRSAGRVADTVPRGAQLGWRTPRLRPMTDKFHVKSSEGRGVVGAEMLG